MSVPSPISEPWNAFQRTLIYVAATIFSLLAFRWLYLFILTDYRSHHRPIIIPLAFFTLIFATGLFRLSSAAVLFMLLLAAIAGTGALYLQISAIALQPFLATVVAISVLYLCVLVPSFTRRA